MLRKSGILQGYLDGHFHGERAITRNECAAALFALREKTGKFEKLRPHLVTDSLLAALEPARGYGGTEGVVPPEPPFIEPKRSPSDQFKDIHYKPRYFDEVNAVEMRGILKGYPTGFYAGSKKLTRAELAHIVTRLAQRMPNPPALNLEKANFKDVAGDEWYFGPVLVAAGSGLMPGFADGTFRSKQPVTRNEFAVILARLLDARFQADAGSKE